MKKLITAIIEFFFKKETEEINGYWIYLQLEEERILLDTKIQLENNKEILKRAKKIYGRKRVYKRYLNGLITTKPRIFTKVLEKKSVTLKQIKNIKNISLNDMLNIHNTNVVFASIRDKPPLDFDTVCRYDQTI